MSSDLRVSDLRALVFDVFGTVVDWRAGVVREARTFLRRFGPAGANDAANANAEAFADAWRRLYVPSMDACRSGRRPFVPLDILHRESLEAILPQFGIDPESIPEQALEELNRSWHRLDPWPDA